jgi:hypothetical protein
MKYRVALVKWAPEDGITKSLGNELESQGHEPVPFLYDQPIPQGVDILLTFAPYNRILHIPHQISKLPLAERPLYIHWNFEGLPNIKLPWPILRSLSTSRSWFDRLNDSPSPAVRALQQRVPLRWLHRRMNKWRYLGDYHYAYRHNQMQILADISQVYAGFHNQHGLPTIHVPWGTSPAWYKTLGLARDIDVLWMGSRRTRRRSLLLDHLRAELERRGLNIHIADGVENPLIYGRARTDILNRAKITLNLIPTRHDPAFIFRFHMAAGNRSLIISEPTLHHCECGEHDVHYIASPAHKLVETILFYLENDAERDRLVDNAFHLVTEHLTLANSVKRLMKSVITSAPPIASK